MEELDQAYGYILYRTTLKAGGGNVGSGPALLQIDAVHSYARVYVDGALQGTIDRRLGQAQLRINVQAGQRLDVLVENSGRINFTTKIRGERAGIVGDVKLERFAARLGDRSAATRSAARRWLSRTGMRRALLLSEQFPGQRSRRYLSEHLEPGQRCCVGEWASAGTILEYRPDGQPVPAGRLVAHWR